MAAIVKIYFVLLLLNRKANWLGTWQETPSEILKIVRGRHLLDKVFASSPELEGQLT